MTNSHLKQYTKICFIVTSSRDGNTFFSTATVSDENMEAPLQARAPKGCSVMGLAAQVAWISRLGLGKIPEQIL